MFGCSGQPIESADDPVPPLTVKAWRELPVEQKYDEATFSRLKDAAPKRQTSPSHRHRGIGSTWAS
ncbi:hypothetical protein [Thalassoroseus pseudoceratinae]|uniref:hypothetical protein n=1 Tax=Thalassoroseus pseudoceratinae TaxID=2713176 RepID=UPI00142202FD|nr:hypothetical protein [Thalassoroseus pseudoceratinae]